MDCPDGHHGTVMDRECSVVGRLSPPYLLVTCLDTWAGNSHAEEHIGKIAILK